MHKLLLTAALLTALVFTPANAELDDPTRPSYAVAETATTTAGATLRVSAVFISGDRRIAVINGQRFREGESVAGAVVSAITRNEVSFVRGDRAFSVSLLSGPSRQ